YQEGYERAVQEAREALARLQSLVRLPEARALVQEVARHYQQYADVSTRLFGQVRPEELSQIAVAMDSTRNQLIKALGDLEAFQAQLFQQVQVTAANAHAQARSVMVVTAALALIVGVCASLLVQRNVTGAVRQAA